MTRSTDSDTTCLYLLRHGATVANEQRPYILQGRGIDQRLSETGKGQARAAADFLKRFSLDHVYSSEMLRAVETAELIAQPHGLEVETVAGLVECDVGRWEGMDWTSIEREFPAAYRAFMEDPAENPYLEGESYQDVLRRVRPAIEGLLKRHVGASIVVVAHNVVNRAYLAGLLGLGLRKAKEIPQSNTGVNVIHYNDETGESKLRTLNAHFHLDVT